MGLTRFFYKTTVLLYLSHKIAPTSVIGDISIQSLEIKFQLSANSSLTLPYTRNKEALPWQSILVLKLVHFYKGIRQRECKKSQYKKNIELTLAPVLRDLMSLQLSPCT